MRGAKATNNRKTVVLGRMHCNVQGRLGHLCEERLAAGLQVQSSTLACRRRVAKKGFNKRRRTEDRYLAHGIYVARICEFTSNDKPTGQWVQLLLAARSLPAYACLATPYLRAEPRPNVSAHQRHPPHVVEISANFFPPWYANE